MYTPKRGDAVWLNFSPQTGREQAGHRAAFVVSPVTYNSKVGLALVCPITTQVKGYPFEVEIPSGLKVGGAVLADQVKSLDWRSREATFICDLPSEVTLEIIGKIGTLIR